MVFGCRIVTFNQSTRPIIELYEKKNLAQQIDASKDVDHVRYFSKIFSFIVGNSYLISGI